MKLLLFDVDQTLINTGGAGIRALNRAFRKVLKLDNAMDGITPHGKTDPAIVREALANVWDGKPAGDCVPAILDAYIFFLQEEVERSEAYRVLPGIAVILGEITRRNGVMLGLATGNLEKGARIKLHRGGLNGYFTFGGFGSDSEDRLMLVQRAAELGTHRSGGTMDPENVFVIGDTPRDVEAGRKAGFRTVGVATGGYSTDQLRQHEACCVISNFEQDREQFLNFIDS